jgi:putative transposase
MVETVRYFRHRLPHWLVTDRPYFVTLRLRGTLPKAVVSELAAERKELAERANMDEEAWAEMQRRHFAKIEHILDACDNSRKWLAQAEVATVVMTNLAWLEEVRGWKVYAATVMPNHLHLLMRNLGGRNGELITDLAHFKSFTGQKANQVLGRSGSFWAREDFDHGVVSWPRRRALRGTSAITP